MKSPTKTPKGDFSCDRLWIWALFQSLCPKFHSPHLPKNRAFQENSTVINLLLGTFITFISGDKVTAIRSHLHRCCHKNTTFPICSPKGLFILPRSHLFFYLHALFSHLSFPTDMLDQPPILTTPLSNIFLCASA